MAPAPEPDPGPVGLLLGVHQVGAMLVHLSSGVVAMASPPSMRVRSHQFAVDPDIGEDSLELVDATIFDGC